MSRKEGQAAMIATTASPTLSKAPALRHLSLQGVLPPGSVLAMHPTLSILVVLVGGKTAGERPCIQGIQQFTLSEVCVLWPLLEAHPHFCPYEVLLASFGASSANVTEALVEQCRKRLHRALDEGRYDQEIRPVRNVLSRVRLKLHEVGIEIVNLHEAGYMLLAYTGKPAKRKQQEPTRG